MKRVLSVLAGLLFVCAFSLPTLALEKPAARSTKSVATASTAKVAGKTVAKAHVKNHTVDRSHREMKNEKRKG
jgi:hypothetical protein